MPITQLTVATPAAEVLFNDTAIGATVDAVKASSCKVLWLLIDNSANVAPSYVKLFNLASGSVTVGTTVPDEVIYVPASSVISVPMFTGANPGKTFGTALSAACVTAGGTAGTTPPVSSVPITIAYV